MLYAVTPTKFRYPLTVKAAVDWRPRPNGRLGGEPSARARFPAWSQTQPGFVQLTGNASGGIFEGGVETGT